MTELGQTQVKPKRQSQVTEQINNLESNLGALHDSIGDLTDRLSSVLKAPKAPKEEESKIRVELVVLADTIQGFDDSVKSAVSKLEDILERLEI